MKTVKVGDKVRVVDNTTGHGFDVGSIVTVTETYINVVRATDGVEKFYISSYEYEPIAPSLIVAGGEYTSHNGNKWKCIFVDGDNTWLAPEGMKSAAYVFTTDGTNISQGGGEYNIKFDPVVETVNVKGSINKHLDSDGFTTYHEMYGDHKFNMTVDFIDGQPDWSTAKVTEA